MKNNPSIQQIWEGEAVEHIYVHVPFCRSICSYCAFARTASLSKMESWIKKIMQESQEAIGLLHARDPEFKIQTLYFGGGTPSLLEGENLGALASPFLPFLNQETEWTVEINPDSVTLDQLLYMKKLGINRLSIGIQSFHDESLRKMGRKHTAAQAEQAICMARKAGFENLSVDLIYGLPWTDMRDLEEDLDAFLALNVPHISIYSLQIEEDSVFGKTGLQPIDEDIEADMYEALCTRLKAEGYEHYEISSFARAGYRSRHNMCYWSDRPYLGLGWGADGYSGRHWYRHKGSLENYLRDGAVLERQEDLDPAFASIMMGLRTIDGLDIMAWQKKYQQDFSRFSSISTHFPASLLYENGRVRVSEHGMEILNSILVAFLEYF